MGTKLEGGGGKAIVAKPLKKELSFFAASIMHLLHLFTQAFTVLYFRVADPMYELLCPSVSPSIHKSIIPSVVVLVFGAIFFYIL